MKTMLAQKCGLEPKEQRLFFRGKEKEDDESLHMAGLKDNSKVLLLEDQASKERKLEQLKKAGEISKACEAVADVRAEVDKISERVSCKHLLVAFACNSELWLIRHNLAISGGCFRSSCAWCEESFRQGI